LSRFRINGVIAEAAKIAHSSDGHNALPAGIVNRL